MYGIQDKINQILRGAETIRKNQSMLTAQSDPLALYHALCDMTKDLIEKTNEAARLREENQNLKLSEADLSEELKISDDWLVHTRKEVARLREDLELYKVANSDVRRIADERNKAEKEVARLRELLNRAIEMAEEAIRLADIDYENDKFGKVTWLKKEVAEIETTARLAHAPKEPTIKESLQVESDQFRDATKMVSDHIVDANEMVSSCCNAYCAKRIDGNVAYWDCDQCGATDKVENPVIKENQITEPAPEWRELGLNDAICEGDEIQWPEKDWQTAKSSVGYWLIRLAILQIKWIFRIGWELKDTGRLPDGSLGMIPSCGGRFFWEEWQNKQSGETKYIEK
jgi:hypothetical protein